MDKGKLSRLLQTVSIVVAALMAGSNIAFFAQAFSGGYHPAYLAVCATLAVALAVLVALPLRLYENGAMRTLGDVCSGFLGAAGLLGGLVLARGRLWGVPSNALWLTVTVVAILSLFCSAIVLYLKVWMSEEGARLGSACGTSNHLLSRSNLRSTWRDVAGVLNELRMEAREALAGMKSWGRLPGLLLTVVLMVSLGVGVWLDQNGPQWRRASEMMKILPADVSLIWYLDFGGRYPAAYRDEVVFEGHDEFCGQDLKAIRGRGVGYFQNVDNDTGQSSQELAVYEGRFDEASMVRALEAKDGFGPPSRLGGILMWTSTHGSVSTSIALIDHFIVSGTTERVQQCVEAAQGKRESFYANEHARDVLNRLTKGDSLGLAAGLQAGEDRPGLLATVECFRFRTSNYAPNKHTTVEKYCDVDSATARIARLEAESESNPTGFKISQDGVFVTYTRVVNGY
jgi:hypothetical protein